MTEPRIVTREPETGREPPFAKVLCAVDGSRGSKVALRQAIALSGPAVDLRFVAIANERASAEGNTEVDLSESRAREALDEATEEAHRAGIEATPELLHGAPTSDRLLTESERCDLLVVGCEDIPRHAGILLGTTATQLAHRSERPLLVARDGAEGKEFPDSILVASEGSAGSWDVAKTAIGIGQWRGARLHFIYVPGEMHPEHYRRVQEQMQLAEEEIGVSPGLTAEPGRVAEEIEKAAEAIQPSLIVMGKRGISGAKALGSVSERVVHKAPSSVLVVPPS